MEDIHSFWQLGDELRGQSKEFEDHKWFLAASRLAEQTRSKVEPRINIDLSKDPAEVKPTVNLGYREENKFESFNFNMLNLQTKMNENVNKPLLRKTIYNMNAIYQNPNVNSGGNTAGSKYSSNNPSKESNNYTSSKEDSTNASNAIEKRFKTLPAAEVLPRNEVLEETTLRVATKI